MNVPSKESSVQLDYQKINDQLAKITEDLHELKSQLPSFYRFINIGGLKRNIKLLVNLCQTNESSLHNTTSGTNSRTDRMSAHFKLEDYNCLSVEQDSVSDTFHSGEIKHTPTVYSTCTVQTGDTPKWRKLCGRAKLSAVEQLIYNANQTLQVSMTPHNIRYGINSVCQEIYTLQILLENLKVLTQKLIDSQSRNEKSVDYEGVNKFLRSNTLKMRKIMLRLVEYVEKINNRRFIDRILLHLRRRSTASYFLYLIDQEKGEKAKWKI
ncbi:unnamed protein product [Trichobilharzia regenti]|uniref:Spindle and centriole-associated protein 1 n=1 Tax=Trichobilharzia regenti TaxID=157069 RepID=A0A183WMG1_TRIRE|nr:unnamed protein product [Trichobilharzia regenti]VDQ09194.1 unnamed protein product [Trichobilharzia regenti]